MTIDNQKLQKLLWSEVASWKDDCGEWKQNAEALGEFLGEKTVEEVALELLAENESLRGLYQMHKATETREMRDLKAQLAGLKTGYEAYERVNAELKDENDALRAKRLPGAARAKKLVGIASSHRRDALALRKDIESNKRMLLAAVCDLGAIGRALKVDMDADGDELLGTVIDLKAQNTRMLEWLKDISRTSGDKGAVMGARQLLKEFADE